MAFAHGSRRTATRGRRNAVANQHALTTSSHKLIAQCGTVHDIVVSVFVFSADTRYLNFFQGPEEQCTRSIGASLPAMKQETVQLGKNPFYIVLQVSRSPSLFAQFSLMDLKFESKPSPKVTR